MYVLLLYVVLQLHSVHMLYIFQAYVNFLAWLGGVIYVDLLITKYYQHLPFIDNGILIDPNPNTWKCQQTNRTDTNDNLWLNLSDGFIGGGRQHWDVSV